MVLNFPSAAAIDKARRLSEFNGDTDRARYWSGRACAIYPDLFCPR